MELPDVPVVLLELESLELLPERRSIHGTATCLPLLLELLLLGLVEVVDVLEEVDDVSDAELAAEPEPLRDRMAKSTRPDMGLMMTSLSVPMVCPDELVTCAPWISEARMCCCWLERPVALRPELDDSPELDVLPLPEL